MVYIFLKDTSALCGKFKNIIDAKDFIINELHKDPDSFTFLQDMSNHIISRTTYVDGECVYNKVSFWNQDLRAFLATYELHDVTDFMGLPITKTRFENEWISNSNKIGLIDGRPGQITYNIAIGNEFISLFREECIVTDFSKYDTTPLKISEKLYPVIGLVQTGSFREAKLMLLQLMQTPGFTDKFLSIERLTKYVNMLDAADAIEYATAEEYFYPRSNEVSKLVEEENE